MYLSFVYIVREVNIYTYPLFILGSEYMYLSFVYIVREVNICTYPLFILLGK